MEDKAKGGVLLVLWVGSFERKGCREGLEPRKGGLVRVTVNKRVEMEDIPAVCLAFKIEDCVFDVGV